MGESTLFQGITVYISGDPDKKVLDLLTKGKGSMSKFTMEKATHVLCGKNFEESHVQEARELYEIPVVNENWIWNSVRLNKLVPTRPYAPYTNGKLFHGCIFTMTLIEPQDRIKLYAMITLHGGAVQKDLDNKVTHLISGGSQSVALKVAGLTKMTIITPDWVVECLKAKKLVESEMFHPNLLISPIKQQSKITLMSGGGDLKSPSAIRSQLQQNVRPTRPMVVQMQHTPQQINEIIQSQIQQQQLQEQAKQRAAQAAQQNQSSILLAHNQQTESPANTSTLLQKQQSNPTAPAPQNQTNVTPPTPSVPLAQPIPSQNPNNQPQAQMTATATINPPQHPTPTHVTAINTQQTPQQPQLPPGSQANIIQRQISLPSSTGQQVTSNINQQQQQFINNQQQMKFQQNKANITAIPQQQQQQQIINTQQNQAFVQTQNQNQPSNPQQQQQFIMKQQNQTPGSGSGYIQIIQQGKQIIQIQHPDGGQMHQKNFTMQNQSQSQQIQLNQALQQQNPPNVTIQNIQNPQQQAQVPSSPIPQQQQQQSVPRQNIVIINQLQNPQNPNQISLQQQTGQRFQAPPPQQQQQQAAFQKTTIGNPQIIQQKLLTANDGIPVQQQQQTQPIQQQEGIPNVVHIQQTQNIPVQQQQQQQTQAQLTQAQAVLQIAQQLQSGTENVQGTQPIQFSNQITQSPTQQQQTQPVPAPQGQTVVQQHIITTNQAGQPVQQFIRTTGPRPIFLDSQSSIQFQQMNPAQRQEYLEQLHNKQQQQQRGVMFQQQRAVTPQNTTIQGVPGQQRAQHHIVIRSQVPPGLTPQQQLQWLQNQRRQILIRPPINQQQIIANQQQQMQIQVDPNATPQQQQIQRQQQFQRLQQMQQQQQNQQKMTGNVQTPVSPRGPGFIQSASGDGVNMVDPQSQQIVTNDGGVSSSKTKTALANMLSSRLGGNNNGNVPIVDQSGGVVEQSAAGTLRMMTAQHNAALNVQGMTPNVVRNPQELIVLQQQQQQAQIQQQMVPGQTIIQTHQQIQQRRTLGNITNATGAAGVVPNSPVIVTNQMPPGAQVIMPQSPSTAIKGQPPFSPGRAPPPQIVNRPQFYGHNPNLKLPQELFLLGCHFYIVEYDEINPEDLPDWIKAIKHHGGEIENCYNLKVTHVLCKTQKHGIVMQAIRDNKRCVTAYWLNDIILKKQVIPPWQAIHFPSSAVFGTMRPGMKHVITIMSFEGDERERVKRMIEESGAKLTTYLNRQNTVMVCKRLDLMKKKYVYAKEFNTPMVNVVWLSDLLLGNTSMISQYDSPKYQQYNLPQPLRIDHSILPQLMNSWKAPINLTQEAHERLKRSQMEPNVKRAKKMRTIPPLETIPEEIQCIQKPEIHEIPIVMFSHVDNLDGLTRAVICLGGRVTEDRNEMTHLVMTKPNRTMKFMYALCRAKYILQSTWLEESAKAGQFQPADNYWIPDLTHANFKCEIPSVIKSPIRNNLFENRVFYITPSVMPAPSYLRWLIEQSGGQWELNRRSVMKIHELNQQSPNSYIVISCPEDLHLLGFKHYVCYVATSEFILQSIMTQTIDFLKSELQLSR